MTSPSTKAADNLWSASIVFCLPAKDVAKPLTLAWSIAPSATFKSAKSPEVATVDKPLTKLADNLWSASIVFCLPDNASVKPLTLAWSIDASAIVKSAKSPDVATVDKSAELAFNAILSAFVLTWLSKAVNAAPTVPVADVAVYESVVAS